MNIPDKHTKFPLAYYDRLCFLKNIVINPNIIVVCLLSIFFMLIAQGSALANVAQPGLWGAGGTVRFSPLFASDSIYYQKIQMVDELVTIKLYDGYAAVKGTYWMYNTLQDTITLQTGYPVNSGIEANTNYYLSDVVFDSLYKLKAFSNGRELVYSKHEIDIPNSYYGTEDWFIWTNEFAPKDTTIINIYFLVKTEGANIREGYATEDINGFIYLLESGATWKPPIIHGKVQISLDESVSFRKIRGIHPDTIYKWDEENQLLLYEFQDLKPTSDNNLVITYKGKKTKVKFEDAVKDYESIFLDLDEIEHIKIDGSRLVDKKFKSPFNAHTIGINPMAMAILMIVLVICAVVAVLRSLIQAHKRT